MAQSSGIETTWSQWGVYLCLVSASLVLLILEQAKVGGILWDAARITVAPGQALVSKLEQLTSSSKQWFHWRREIVIRLAEAEHAWHQEAVKSALLTETVTSLRSQLPSTTNASTLQSALRLEDWQVVTWEGVPGAWQIRAGCLAGLEVGDPVVSARGVLVGVVSEVRRSYSFVNSWDSAEVSIPVRVGTPSAAAVVHGSANGVRLAQLAWPSEVKEGDSVFSAGSQFVPRGLVIGSLENLDGQDVFGEATASITPPVSVKHLETVLIPPTNGFTCGE